MRMREIGVGGPSVAVVGCGDVSLARAAARGLDSSEVKRALGAAIELGVGLVDVAEDADTLKLVGDAIRSQRARDRVVVATRVPPRTKGTWADALSQALPVHHVVEQVDAALRASKLDAIGLAQLPLWPEFRDSTAWAELQGICAQLVRDGKVQRWGAIVEEVDAPDAAEKLADDHWLACVQVTFSACAREAGPLIDRLAKRGVSVLARRVLAGGTLAGAIGPGAKLSLRDDRGELEPAELVRIAVGAAELAALVSHEPAVARSCVQARARLDTVKTRRPDAIESATIADLALRYAIDRPGITCALVRLHRHEHVLGAMTAAGADSLSPELMKRLGALDI